MGLQAEIPPFRLTLVELIRIATAIRAALDEGAK